MFREWLGSQVRLSSSSSSLGDIGSSSSGVLGVSGVVEDRKKTGSRRRNVIKEDISGGPWGFSRGPWWGSFLVVLGSQRVSTRGSILGVSAQALTKASK